jgi:hypothetical protein
MNKYIILLLIFLLLFYLYISTIKNKTEWSKNWTILDFKARNNSNCNPIKKEYKKLGAIESWIWTMNDTCENGLPHTRDFNIIAIPEKYSKTISPMTIEHEKIHLHQRHVPDDWKKFYKIYWDYEIFQEPPKTMPKELIEMKRANPDTNDAPFACWKNKWWSIPVYKSSNDLKFINCIVKWWNQETNEIFTDPPNDWILFFGSNVLQTEHPHEISAIYISNILFGNYNESIKGMNILNQNWDYINEKFKIF